MTIASPEQISQPLAGPSTSKSTGSKGKEENFDVVDAYRRAIEYDHYPHPIAAILALVQLMEASTSATTTGLATDLKTGASRLIDTQPSLGVRAGCQLWGHYFAESIISVDNFAEYKKDLIKQGKTYCTVTADKHREQIAELAVGFLRDDCTILTHSYSRTVMRTLLKAHKQNERIKVYVTEAKPNCLGLRTYDELTAAGIPCTVVLDSAVAYIMERVDMVLVGSEAVVESGGLVSAVGTYQIGLVAKALSKPFYALAESYKFLRHYPLSQTDIPLPKRAGSRPVQPLTIAASAPHPKSETPTLEKDAQSRREREMTRGMIDLNPLVDITTPDLIDFIITELGAPLSPTSVSQYLVAQFYH